MFRLRGLGGFKRCQKATRATTCAVRCDLSSISRWRWRLLFEGAEGHLLGHEQRRMNPRKVWTRSPHSGGSRIPPAVQVQTRQRILAHAAAHYAGSFTRIEVRFRGAFCYIDAYREPDPPTKDLLGTRGETKAQYYERLRNAPIHLCRLRYFAARQRWSAAFYTYSHERYEPALFPSGDVLGTPEEGFDLGAVYLG